MNRNKCVIVVPIYKEKFDFDEYHSIKQLFKILPTDKYDIIAFGPESLNRKYYFENFDFKDHYYFWDSYFNEYPKGYNSLMLKSGFYSCFEQYEYMLIYQPDCWVFRDELEYWCDKGYDYIGAPFFYNTQNKNYLSHPENEIGNGGFSLRKINYWINFCNDYEKECNHIANLSSNMFGEDHIFTYMFQYGIKLNINLPNFIEANKFSWEIQPQISYTINGGKLPFGCHAYNKIMDKSFWDDFICYHKKSYSVVTYLFGDYDILRDPDEIDENAEYICLTDRDDLESDIWEFKKLDFPNLEKYNSWQKTLIARYTALNYINTDTCIKIDASVHIKKSLSKLIYKFKAIKEQQFGILIHPWRDDYLEEYDEWINTRNLDPLQKEQFIKYCKDHNYDINKKGMIMTTIMLYKNDEYSKNCDNYILNELINNYDFNIRVDQTYFSIIFINNFLTNDKCYVYLSMQVLDSDYFEYFYHGQNYTHSGEYKYDLSKFDYGNLYGIEFQLHYLT